MKLSISRRIASVAEWLGTTTLPAKRAAVVADTEPYRGFEDVLELTEDVKEPLLSTTWAFESALLWRLS